jgi:hypothetical protein
MDCTFHFSGLLIATRNLHVFETGNKDEDDFVMIENRNTDPTMEQAEREA